jgi:predicted outer membrane repeat protein
VADGRYRGPGNRGLRFDGKAIELRSTGGAEACIIDVESQGSAFLFLLFEPAGTLVEGFTITGASGSAVWTHHAAEPEFRDCIFRDNRGGAGGALRSDALAAPVLRGCLLEGNEANQGGAVFYLGHAAGHAQFIDCIFAGNRATEGGAIYTTGPALQMINCLFTENEADADGGALRTVGSDAELINCTLSRNRAARGGAIAASGISEAVAITGSILWGNQAEFGHEIALLESALHGSPWLIIAHSVLQGGPSEAYLEGGAMLDIGPGLIEHDPMFADPGRGDFRLLAGSPAIDAGDNTALPPHILTDLAGLPRFIDDPAAPDVGVPGGAGGHAITDIGAYERNFCYADCDASGDLDFFDFLCFQDAFAAGEPYADCDASGHLDFFDFLCFQNAFAAGCP